MRILLMILSVSFYSFSLNEVKIVRASMVVDGFTCSMCGLGVEKSLQTLSFVKSVETDLQSARVQITFKPGTTVYPDQIGKKVKAAGFSVSSLTYYFEEKINVADALGVNGYSYGICTPHSNTTLDSARVVGKLLLSGKELKSIVQLHTCEDSRYSYWLLPY